MLAIGIRKKGFPPQNGVYKGSIIRAALQFYYKTTGAYRSGTGFLLVYSGLMLKSPKDEC